MLTEKEFEEAAKALGCESAVIRAVALVESGARKSGFLANGKVVILFEPHIFWRQLRVFKINPVEIQKKHPALCYPVWDRKKYGTIAQQHPKLEAAKKIHEWAALRSCSWGRFQIMGFNWKLAGSNSIHNFVSRMQTNEGEHLKMFVTYIKAIKLDDELKYKDWLGFALGYNGPLHWKNNYVGKLKKAYVSFI